MKMGSDVHQRVGTPHMKMCSDVHHRVGTTEHIKMCSVVLTGVWTPHNFRDNLGRWVCGWVGVKMQNHATLWLHLARLNLPDLQHS